MLTPNRADKRWAFVFKTYSQGDQAPVLFDVAIFAANLMGLDRITSTIAVERKAYLHSVYGSALALGTRDRYTRHTPRAPFDPAAAESQLRWLNGRMSEEMAKVGKHQYEALIPWYASRLAKLWKKLVRDEALDVIPGAAYDYDTKDLEWGDITNEFDRYGSTLGELVKHYRLDVNKLSLAEALDRIKDWIENKGRILGIEGDVVKRWSDGWTVQNLTTRAQLQEEGNAMDHCVGSYCPQVERGDVVILSLRNPAGESMATLEWDTDEGLWEQIQGPNNQRPAEETWPYLKELTEKWAPEGSEPSPETAKSWFGESTEMLKAADENGWTVYKFLGEGRLRDWGSSIGSRDLDHVRAGRAMQEGGQYLIEVPATSAGQYATLYDTANNRAILRDFDSNPDVFDGPGMVLINAASSDPELLELLEQMTYDYTYDEQVYNKVQEEAEEESWEGWYESEYEKKLASQGFDEEEGEQIEDAIEFISDLQDKRALRNVFDMVASSEEVYWEDDQEGGRRVDVEQVADATPPAALLYPIFDISWGNDLAGESPRSEPLVKRLQELLGMVREPTVVQLKAIVRGMGRLGIAPDDQALFIYDEDAHEKQLRDAELTAGVIEQLANRLTAPERREYVELASAWVTLQSLWEVLDQVERGNLDMEMVGAARLILNGQEAIEEALSASRSWANYYRPPEESADAAE